MTGEACITVYNQAERHNKASDLDAHSPNCACEAHSLGSEQAEPLLGDEIIIRILVSPSHFDLEKGELVRGKLTSTYSSGLSLLRHRATDDEIRLTVHQLTQNTAEVNTLYGAAVFRTSAIRKIGAPDRWFCVYDTFADGKPFHADIMATTPQSAGLTKSAIGKIKSDRRSALAEIFTSNIILSSSVDDLIQQIRALV